MKTVEEIQQMLDESVNVLLGQHRGSVKIVSIDREPKDSDTKVHAHAAHVKMIGGCRGCAGARFTLATIVSNSIKNFDPTIDYIVDITDHTDNSQAFFKE